MKKTLRDNKRWFIGLGIGVLAAVIFPQVVRIRFVWNLFVPDSGLGNCGHGLERNRWILRTGFQRTQPVLWHRSLYGGACRILFQNQPMDFHMDWSWHFHAHCIYSGKTSPEAEGTCICHIHHGSGGMYQNHIHQLEMVRGRHRSLYLFKRCE